MDGSRGKNGRFWPKSPIFGLYRLITFDSEPSFLYQTYSRLNRVREIDFWRFQSPKMKANNSFNVKSAQNRPFSAFWPNFCLLTLIIHNFLLSNDWKLLPRPISHARSSFLAFLSRKNNHKCIEIDVKILENRQNHVLRFALEIDVPIRFRTWFYVFWKLDKIC